MRNRDDMKSLRRRPRRSDGPSRHTHCYEEAMIRQYWMTQLSQIGDFDDVVPQLGCLICFSGRAKVFNTSLAPPLYSVLAFTKSTCLDPDTTGPCPPGALPNRLFGAITLESPPGDYPDLAMPTELFSPYEGFSLGWEETHVTFMIPLVWGSHALVPPGKANALCENLRAHPESGRQDPGLGGSLPRSRLSWRSRLPSRVPPRCFQVSSTVATNDTSGKLYH